MCSCVHEQSVTKCAAAQQASNSARKKCGEEVEEEEEEEEEQRVETGIHAQDVANIQRGKGAAYHSTDTIRSRSLGDLMVVKVVTSSNPRSNIN